MYHIVEIVFQLTMKMNGSGCVFDYYGRVPNTIYHPQNFQSPVEETVYQNDTKTLLKYVQVCVARQQTV